MNRVKCHDYYDDSDKELQTWCKVGRQVKFHVGIMLHDPCIYMISLTFAKKSRTVRFSYGVATVKTHCRAVIQTQCTLNRTVGNIYSTNSRGAPHSAIHENITRTAPHRTVKETIHTAPHRTAPWDIEKEKTASHCTVRFPKIKNRTEQHSGTLKIVKPHRGTVVHREKPWNYVSSPVCRLKVRRAESPKD